MLARNNYNINEKFDYDAIRTIVINSLNKIAKEEAKNRCGTSCGYSGVYYNPYNITHATQPTPLLKLKIRNSTEYLKWRLSVLKRDNFTCRLCHGSIKENKSLRLEVHHPKPFDEICKENMVSTIEQALTCESFNCGI